MCVRLLIKKKKEKKNIIALTHSTQVASHQFINMLENVQLKYCTHFEKCQIMINLMDRLIDAYM